MDKIDDKIIAYSLGDFCSAHDAEYATDVGKVLTIDVKNKSYKEVNIETIISKNNYKVKFQK